MNGQAVLGCHGAMILLSLALAGCAPNGAPPATESTTPPPVEARVLIECFYPDGTEAGTFTRLDEAWASTNYVRIDHCQAQAVDPDDFELSRTEAAVAGVAAGGATSADPAELFLSTLAACVRIAPEGEYSMASQPTSILEAALMLCPDAPHAGLIDSELRTRG
jgi:hypothetical protein